MADSYLGIGLDLELMPTYRLRGAIRQENGEIGEPKLDEVFDADDRAAALRHARERALIGYDEAVNALWLTDAGNNTIWSLRVADDN
ncbi:hypothetical protein [Methylobacterium gnaphalii]|uniref:Uncharacterized protein n=1 Tax=Methylobacterium gnaphalii TaxID=1010610 RepID=A0A512JJR9_9HYPH|nr:hypothetical protein [Methylobacterium gnaphalii]GEP10170.1 hypothetical protein MGN01_20150 [Methylobacterium gnaphalii]GLS48686.1 hypothetical protein GCM10007885_15300 [Methylobacterium gnaphalii]